MSDLDLLLRAAQRDAHRGDRSAGGGDGGGRLRALRDETLNRGQTPVLALAAHPAWKDLWYDEPTRQCGRPMRYYQQPQALDVEGAWREVSVPTLIVWGEYDGFVYGDAKQAFDEKGGRFDEGAAKVLSDWLRAH